MLLLAVFLIILSTIFSASESAFLSINKLRIRVLRGKKDKKAQRTGSLLDAKPKLLNSILIGNNVVNIAITSILTGIALELFGEKGVGIATVVSTVVLLIFGEITPKTIASMHPEKMAFLFSPFLSLIMKILTPLVHLFTGFANMVAKIFGINTSDKNISFTEEEIKTFIDAGAEEGVIEDGEKTMLRQVFKFADLTAKEIMTPRTNIVAIPVTATYSEIIEIAQKTRFSRFPVYNGGLDDICGILYLKDMLLAVDDSDFNLKKILRPPLFILENRRISSMRKIFRETNQNIAVVVDEYSGTSGLITIEDLTIEIFGKVELKDEDKSFEKKDSPFEKDLEIDGSMRLSDVSELLGIPLESEFYDTIGGFIAEKKGDIPEENTIVEILDWRFTVLSMEDRRVNKILVHFCGTENQDEEQ